MLKKSSFIVLLFIAFVPMTYADINGVIAADIVKAVHSRVIEKTQEDSPGCSTTRYVFAHPVNGVKLESKCNRINVSWFQSKEPQNREISRVGTKLARRTVIELSYGSGIEVEKVLVGGKYKNRFIAMNSCSVCSVLAPNAY